MRRLVLLGGGHAHIEVLRQAAMQRFTGGEITLISPSSHAHYTGMVPGYVRGTLAEPALTIDLAALCRAGGVTFIEGYATAVAADGRSVDVNGAPLGCDLVSADVGSAPQGLESVPGVARHAYGARPMAKARALTGALDRARNSPAEAICVVGGGAGGVEVALAIRARLDAARGHATVSLVEAGPVLLGGHADRASRLALSALAAAGITVHTTSTVARVGAREVLLRDGSVLPSTITVWLAGASPTALTQATLLPKDDRGFWLVDATLRSVSGAPVWGAGDCVALAGQPWVPKAGVYAVRQAPVLARNLRAALAGGTAAATRRYDPQRTFLAILDTADGRGILRWHGVAMHNRLALMLKTLIDRRFVRRYAVAE